MAQLVPIVSLASAGLGLYATHQQQRQQKKQVAAQNAQITQQNDVQAQQVATAQAEGARQRQASLARTQASVRARLGASGAGSDGGSAAALLDGLRQDSEAAQDADDTAYATRLSAGRRSLLNTDLSFTPYIRAGQQFAGALRNLLD